MSTIEITETRASEILTAFLTQSLTVPDLAEEFEIPLFALLRWFESEPVVRALEQIESLQRLQQALSASAAAPRAVDSLLQTCEGEDSTPAAVSSAANAILRFAAAASKPPRTKTTPPARASQPDRDSSIPAISPPISGSVFTGLQPSEVMQV
jgi:hypothetical protein